ncbi:MAG: alanine racemase [Meiothermus sp.]|nr:alanine racemase [Meiothermus sp.]
MTLDQLETPRLVLDEARLEANLARMARHLAGRAGLRPHMKTAKSAEVAHRALEGQFGGITVSTLKEAEQFLGAGVRDLLYAVGVVPGKLEQVAALQDRGADLTVVLDSAQNARAVAQRAEGLGIRLPVLIEVDTDGHRSGVGPDAPELLEIARILHAHPATELRGVMTHAGESYNRRSVEAIAALAEQERLGVVGPAERIRAAGLPCPVVSVGSTPTALLGRSLEGVTEVRAGVYMFFDLVMAGLGVCGLDEIALSVTCTVIGHQPEKGWVITDAGWMAMSRDRGTAKQPTDQGYGLVCDLEGRPFGDLIVADASQEHGIITHRRGERFDLGAFPVGRVLRVLPNHACATAAAHPAYQVVRSDTEVRAVWERFGFW